MTSEIRHSGASAPTGSTAKSSIRSPGPENHGFDDVWLSEHHFIEDGYLASILPVAAAIAARTNRIRIVSGVLLAPFHNPMRLAEDIATVDVISGGRFELGAGLGFKREEFEGFGAPFKERGVRTNQSLELIRRALVGETVTFKSEFYDFQKARSRRSLSRNPIRRSGWAGSRLLRAKRADSGRSRTQDRTAGVDPNPTFTTSPVGDRVGQKAAIRTGLTPLRQSPARSVCRAA